MKDYKENFYNVIDYAVNKTKAPAWKLILLGIMGSLYVAIAYIAFIMVLSTFDGVIETSSVDVNGQILFTYKEVHIGGGALLASAAIFPVGIMLIIFLGGSLFTSDNLTSIAWITKKSKLLPIVIKWMYTLIGNIIGALIAGAIVRAGNILGNENYQLVLGYLAGKKTDLEWYYAIFSGILCNILVAGSVWASLAASHSTAKLFIIYFPIWLFAIAGFQHIVANAILFSMALFYSINPNEQMSIIAGINFAENHFKYIPDFIIHQSNPANFDEIKQYLLKDNINLDQMKHDWVSLGTFVRKAICNNMLPATLGNWISGAVLLPYTYYWLSSWKKTNNENKLD